MEAAFIRIFNMGITASYIILAVIVLRFLLKKAPKSLCYLLWAMVGIRLIFPFSFESIFSLIPTAKPVPENIGHIASPQIDSNIPDINNVFNPWGSQILVPVPEAGIHPMQLIIRTASWIWLCGIAVLVIYSIISSIRLKQKVRTAVRLDCKKSSVSAGNTDGSFQTQQAPLTGRSTSGRNSDNIWQCEFITTPFILGIIRPKIYIPYGLSPETQRYVLAHEHMHLRHCDHWIKPLGFILCIFYWFQPLVWAAWIFMCRDIELACDASVIRSFNTTQKKAYSMALLECSTGKQKNIAPYPLAFGQGSVKVRIKNILNAKQPAFWSIIAAILLCIAAALCFLTNPPSQAEDSQAVGDSGINTYKVTCILYDAPMFNSTYTTGPNATTPSFRISDDGTINEKGILTDYEWKSRGKLKDIQYTEDEFWAMFNSPEAAPYNPEDFSPKDLLQQNLHMYRAETASDSLNPFILLMQQADEELLLCYGYKNEDISFIRWVFVLNTLSE